MAAKHFTFRIPEALWAKVEARAAIHKRKPSELIIEAIERGWEALESLEPRDAAPIGRSVSAGIGSNSINKQQLRDICAGKIPQHAQEPKEKPEDHPERPMCGYEEYDQDTGETYRCGLRAHGPKVKHTRGERI